MHVLNLFLTPPPQKTFALLVHGWLMPLALACSPKTLDRPIRELTPEIPSQCVLVQRGQKSL